MLTKQMGIDGPEVPVVCFGTWPLGGAYGDFDEQNAISTMQHAIDVGLTFIDTAEGYMRAEEIIGKAIKGRRHELFIATKVSGDDHSTEHIESALDQSLRLMGTDYVDMYQLHRATDRPIADTMSDLLRLQADPVERLQVLVDLIAQSVGCWPVQRVLGQHCDDQLAELTG